MPLVPGVLKQPGAKRHRATHSTHCMMRQLAVLLDYLTMPNKQQHIARCERQRLLLVEHWPHYFSLGRRLPFPHTNRTSLLHTDNLKPITEVLKCEAPCSERTDHLKQSRECQQRKTHCWASSCIPYQKFALVLLSLCSLCSEF